MKYCVYDIETLSNCTTFCFLDFTSKKKKSFVLFEDIAEFYKLISFLESLKKNKYFLVGFNNIGFDMQVIEYMLQKYVDWLKKDYSVQVIVTLIYNKAQELINTPEENRFEILIPEWKFSIPQIDLYKQKHYDRPQKATSLKWLQFVMRRTRVKEMPISHEAVITKEQIPEILDYNWEDVDSTAEFFDKNMFETETRSLLSDRYNLKLLNASEPKMVREIFGKFLSEEMGIPYSDLKKRQTQRSNVRIKDIIFPYIKFETEECNNILKWFQSLNVNPNQKTKIEKHIKYSTCDVVFALGGIHGCIKSGLYTKSEERTIEDIDVVSFYPNLAINNNIKPNHLGDSFNKIYNNIFQERKKIPKTDPINYIFKIILNSAYGLSKEKSCYFYDPLFTYSITINGQLTILMFMEKLLLNIPDIRFYQMNTDGFTIDYANIYKDKVAEICEWFCKTTNFQLEHVFYDKMIINDVNSYIAVYTDGKTKKKGGYDTDMEYHKNPSFLIIPKAIEAYFVHGKDYREFINSHSDIFDFLGAVKKKSNFDINILYLDKGKLSKDHGQKVTRFYVAKSGKKFYKDFKDGRRVGVLADWEVELANDVEDYMINKVNRLFYIKEVEKIIRKIEGNKLQLTLF